MRGNSARGEPVVRPALDARDDVLERLASLRQPVAHAHGDACVHPSRDEARRLELAQALRERARRNLAYGTLDLREAKRTRQQRAQHGTGPAAADDLGRLLEVRAELAARVHR